MASKENANASQMQAPMASQMQQLPPATLGPAGAKKPLPNLANKPGEPAFQLKLEPADKIVLQYTRGVSSHTEIKITNTSKDPQCFKVKCTDNNIFRVRPPLGYIEAGKTFDIKVFQHANELPEENRHFFALYHTKCTADDVKKNVPRNVYKSDTKPDGVTRMLVVFKAAETKPEMDPKSNPLSDASKVDGERETKPKADDKKEEKKEEKKADDKKEDKKDGKEQKKADAPAKPKA